MAGPSSLVLVLVGVLAWVVVGRDDGADEPYVAPVPTATASGVDAPGAAEALQRLVAVLDQGDRAGAQALAAPDDTATAARLADLVDTSRSARVEGVTLRYVTETGGVAADGTWAAAVDATWAFDGFDRRPTAAEVSVRFRPVEGGVAIAGIGGGDLRTPVWMSGPVQVSRSADLLVVAAAGLDLDAYVELARGAIPTVSDVLTDWAPRLVVEVPADEAALESALGVEPGYYGQIAAVTGAGGPVVPGAPVHVFVNPDVFKGLGRAGREVVLAHEATHVATDAPQAQGPTWLTEGFADYVALRRTTLPLTRTAGQVARQVRDEGVPQALPTAAEFDTRGPHLGAVYEGSWLLCVTLAERGGQAALERFYEAVSAGAPLDEQLRRDFDWSEADLVAAWTDRLRDLPVSDA